MEAATAAPVEYDFGPGLRLEERIDAAEGEGIESRWEFGRWMLTHVPEGAKKLPDGFLNRLAEATGKSQSELKYRRQFAEQHSTREALANVLANHPSWHAIVNDDLPKETRADKNTGDNEWFTPPEYIEAARTVMGGIDLDPASSDEANEVVGADCIFTEQYDGLEEKWLGRVWMNPPYSGKLIFPFCEKLADSYAEGDVTQAIVLLNNNTETAWFQRLADLASVVCFPAGRIKFWHPHKEHKDAPLQGQALMYLGENASGFEAEFLCFGVTARF